MNFKLIQYGVIGIAVLGYFGYSAFKDSRPQTADLGQVLDRADYALTNYQVADAESEITDEQMEGFTSFMGDVMNAQPVFYDGALGMELKEDAVFLGFADANANRVRDSGEKDVFKLEVDTENSRLIATDMAGASVHHRYSGSGIITGLLIGNLLSRQSRAGVSRSSFSNRTSTARSNYKPSSRTTSARSRSRSGGSRAGK